MYEKFDEKNGKNILGSKQLFWPKNFVKKFGWKFFGPKNVYCILWELNFKISCNSVEKKWSFGVCLHSRGERGGESSICQNKWDGTEGAISKWLWRCHLKCVYQFRDKNDIYLAQAWGVQTIYRLKEQNKITFENFSPVFSATHVENIFLK